MTSYQVELDGEVFAIGFADDGVYVNEKRVDVDVAHDGALSGHILIHDRSVAFVAEQIEGRGWQVAIKGRKYAARVSSRKDLLMEKFGGSGSASSGHRDIKAPMPGLVLRINVAVGDSVKTGQSLLVLEAMKMENEIGCPGDGVIEAIHVTAGQAVGKSTLLVEIGSTEST